MSLSVLSFGLGAILLLVAIIGGGFQAKEVAIPPVGAKSRVVSGFAGLTFLALALALEFFPEAARLGLIPQLDVSPASSPSVEGTDKPVDIAAQPQEPPSRSEPDTVTPEAKTEPAGRPKKEPPESLTSTAPDEAVSSVQARNKQQGADTEKAPIPGKLNRFSELRGKYFFHVKSNFQILMKDQEYVLSARDDGENIIFRHEKKSGPMENFFVVLNFDVDKDFKFGSSLCLNTYYASSCVDKSYIIGGRSAVCAQYLTSGSSSTYCGAFTTKVLYQKSLEISDIFPNKHPTIITTIPKYEISDDNAAHIFSTFLTETPLRRIYFPVDIEPNEEFYGFLEGRLEAPAIITWE